MTGPVLAGVLAVSSAEDVLRLAFDEAQDRAVGLRVVAARDEMELRDIVGKWAGKYPEVAVAMSVPGAVDPALTFTAATRSCCLAVLPRPTDAYATALIGAVARRSGCPVLIA